MHLLVELHGQPGWVAALTPLSVDGMIVAASSTLLAESRSGGRGGVLPWALLVAGSAASLAAEWPSPSRRSSDAYRGLAVVCADLLLRVADAPRPVGHGVLRAAQETAGIRPEAEPGCRAGRVGSASGARQRTRSAGRSVAGVGMGCGEPIY
jgi:Protein of unknown function (DUF2637)